MIDNLVSFYVTCLFSALACFELSPQWAVHLSISQTHAVHFQFDSVHCLSWEGSDFPASLAKAHSHLLDQLTVTSSIQQPWLFQPLAVAANTKGSRNIGAFHHHLKVSFILAFFPLTEREKGSGYTVKA